MRRSEERGFQRVSEGFLCICLLLSASATTGSGAPQSGSGAPVGSLSYITSVFIILEENHNWADITPSNAPYIRNTLVPTGAHAEQYFNPTGLHPSEPNYIWLEAGDNLGITTDDDPSVNHRSTTDHLVTYLTRAGISWKSYQEDIDGTTCPLTEVNLYRPKHQPFVFFDDVTDTNNLNSPNCIAHIRPYSELATDLQNNTVARYDFITPNECDDMHSCDPSVADAWLSREIPKIMASHAYQNGGAIFITWDEAGTGDGPIGMLVISPFAKQGYSNMIYYTHSSTLRTLQEIFGVSPLLRDAANATDLGDLLTGPPVVSLNPASFNFGNQLVSTPSTPLTAMLSNTGNGPLFISSVAMTGANAAEFALAAGTTCTNGSSVAAGANCLFNVTFTPASTGAKNATITITDDASPATQTINLSGNGIPATVNLSPSPANFPSQRVGTSSAPLTVILTNSGSAALHLAAANAAVISGTNAADFGIASGTTCVNSLTVAASGGTCIINLTFTPGATGARAATLSVTDDANPATQTVTLNGTGIFSAVSLNPRSLNFGSQVINTISAAQGVTLTNSGTDTLHISTIVLGGANAAEFALAVGTTCTNGSSVAAGANCLFNVTFTPASTGAKNATITITDDASPATQTINLSGNGATPPTAILSSNAMAFSDQPVATTSAAQSVTLTNNGGTPLAISSITITGANAAEFALAVGTTCTSGSSVAAGANCTLGITFRPGATGARAATVTIADSAATSPQTIALTGNGTDFTLNVSGSSTVIVTAGASATFTFNVAAVSGFTAAVTFSASGLPAASTATFNPTSVAPPGSTTLTIATAMRSAAPPIGLPGPRPNGTAPLAAFGFVVLPLALAAMVRLARRTGRHAIFVAGWPVYLVLALLLGLAASQLGCQGGGAAGTLPSTSTITVSATGGGITHTTAVTLTVN